MQRLVRRSHDDGFGVSTDPLTISDAYSRFLLRCRAVPRTDGINVRAVFEAVFRECGLPEAIRTDNGAPFASRAPGGLSRLSMWWVQLGIQHERIDPGHPEHRHQGALDPRRDARGSQRVPPAQEAPRLVVGI